MCASMMCTRRSRPSIRKVRCLQMIMRECTLPALQTCRGSVARSTPRTRACGDWTPSATRRASCTDCTTRWRAPSKRTKAPETREMAARPTRSCARISIVSIRGWRVKGAPCFTSTPQHARRTDAKGMTRTAAGGLGPTPRGCCTRDTTRKGSSSTHRGTCRRWYCLLDRIAYAAAIARLLPSSNSIALAPGDALYRPVAWHTRLQQCDILWRRLQRARPEKGRGAQAC